MNKEVKVLHYVYNVPDVIRNAIDRTVASQELVNNRIELCKACPDFREATGQCTHCGCFMPIKTKLQQSKCPEGRW